MTNSKSFSELGLIPNLLQSLTENKISQPTEIQEQVIPIVLNTKNNLVGISQTGTGKTAAFGLPLLQLIDPALHQIQLIVLVPTRELSQQIAKDLFLFSRYIVRIRTEAVYGGVKIEEQLKKLDSPKHIIVATPGRLLDLLNRKVLDISYLKYVVLDEADEMLNMGFKPDIDTFLNVCKPNVRKFLFTSTLPLPIKKMIESYLGKEATIVTIKPKEQVNANIEHRYIAYKFGYKFNYLVAYIIQNKNDKGIIFCRTQAAVKLLKQQLKGEDIEAVALYGDLKQFERSKVMTAFKTNQCKLLIATDIAARGIDVQDVHFVIHYHLPDNDAQFINRSGRTARAGKSGQSICMLQEDEIHQVADFESSLKIQLEPLPITAEIDTLIKDPVSLTINLGLRQGFNTASFIRFIVDESGLKEENITDIELFLAHSTFNVPAKYSNQVLKNIHNTKHFHQKVLLQLN